MLLKGPVTSSQELLPYIQDLDTQLAELKGVYINGTPYNTDLLLLTSNAGETNINTFYLQPLPCPLSLAERLRQSGRGSDALQTTQTGDEHRVTRASPPCGLPPFTSDTSESTPSSVSTDLPQSELDAEVFSGGKGIAGFVNSETRGRVASSKDSEGQIPTTWSADLTGRSPEAPLQGTKESGRAALPNCIPTPVINADENASKPARPDRPPKRKSPSTPRARTRPPTPTNPLGSLEQIRKQVRSVDNLCKVPSFTIELSAAPEVLKLVAAIWSRPAAQQFCSLIQSRRETEMHFSAPHGDMARISQHIKIIETSQRRSGLEKFCVRLARLCLAKEIDRAKDGRLRADPALLKQIKDTNGWDKYTLNRHCDMGRKWARLLGDYQGLLCFIFLGKNAFGISSNSYLELKGQELAMFHRLLKNPHTQSLCAAAKAFEESLVCTSDDVEFSWEGRGCKLETLEDEKMLSSLKPLPSVPENIYDPDKYQTWPRPELWPEEWPWPADPTGHYGLEKCDLCEADNCDCMNKLSDNKPRIRQYRKKGRGLQAVAQERGQVAYRKGDIIGFLNGEVVPAGTYSDGWTLDFVRPDILGEPTVCQIHTKERGNIFRLLNHSHKANAKFEQVKVGGRYRTAVKAWTDIWDGSEIEVSYGPGYEVLGGCCCRACSVTCRETANKDNANGPPSAAPRRRGH